MRTFKSFILLVGMVLGCAAHTYSQNGNGHSATHSYGCTLNVGDIMTGCSHSNGLGNNPWPMNLVTDVLKEAKPFYQQEQGLSLGQLIQAYHDCRCVIMYLGDGWFRVSTGGGDALIHLEDLSF